MHLASQGQTGDQAYMCNVLLSQHNHQAKREPFTKVCQRESFHSQCFTPSLSLKAHLKFLTTMTGRTATFVMKKTAGRSFFDLFPTRQNSSADRKSQKGSGTLQVSKTSFGYHRLNLPANDTDTLSPFSQQH